MNKTVLGLLILSMGLFGCSKKTEITIFDQPTEYFLKSGQIGLDNLVDFGDVGFQDSKLVTIKIENTGTENLTGPVSVSGSDFSIAYQNSCNVIPVGKICTLKIGFNAKGKVNGVHQENLILDTISFPIKANVLPAPSGSENVEFSSLTLDFGSLNQSSSVVKTLTIKNKSLVTLNKIITVGSSFSLSYDACSNKNILPGKSCSVRVSLVGAGKNGNLNESLLYGNETLMVALQGSVLSSEAESLLSSNVKALFQGIEINENTPANLGLLNQGQSYIHTFALKNVGTAGAKISALNFSSQMQVLYTNCPDVSSQKRLDPNETCLVKGSINPIASENITLNVSLSHGVNLSFPINFTSQVLKNITVSGSSKVSIVSNPEGINCSSPSCSKKFAEGSSVVLIANPSLGYEFLNWASVPNNCESTGNQMVCAINSDISISIPQLVCAAGYAPSGQNCIETSVPEISLVWGSYYDDGSVYFMDNDGNTTQMLYDHDGNEFQSSGGYIAGTFSANGHYFFSYYNNDSSEYDLYRVNGTDTPEFLHHAFINNYNLSSAQLLNGNYYIHSYNYNLGVGELLKITPNGEVSSVPNPVVNGNLVSFVDYGGDDGKILIHNNKMFLTATTFDGQNQKLYAFDGTNYQQVNAPNNCQNSWDAPTVFNSKIYYTYRVLSNTNQCVGALLEVDNLNSTIIDQSLHPDGLRSRPVVLNNKLFYVIAEPSVRNIYEYEDTLKFYDGNQVQEVIKAGDVTLDSTYSGLNYQLGTSTPLFYLSKNGVEAKTYRMDSQNNLILFYNFQTALNYGQENGHDQEYLYQISPRGSGFFMATYQRESLGGNSYHYRVKGLILDNLGNILNTVYNVTNSNNQLPQYERYFDFNGQIYNLVLTYNSSGNPAESYIKKVVGNNDVIIYSSLDSPNPVSFYDYRIQEDKVYFEGPGSDAVYMDINENFHYLGTPGFGFNLD